MTNIGHYRAAAKVLEDTSKIPTRLWIGPPTRMDETELKKEGVYAVFNKVGARTEVPGCSLCMGNQARVEDAAHVFSTSTRNFDNRMGKDAQVYLGSAELSAVCATLGKIPTLSEYLAINILNDKQKQFSFDMLNKSQVKGSHHNTIIKAIEQPTDNKLLDQFNSFYIDYCKKKKIDPNLWKLFNL